MYACWYLGICLGAIYETPAGARLFPLNQRVCRLQKCVRCGTIPIHEEARR